MAVSRMHFLATSHVSDWFVPLSSLEMFLKTVTVLKLVLFFSHRLPKRI